MGRQTREVTTYTCDSCGLEQEITQPWFGFAQGRNYEFALSAQRIFCKEACASNWLVRNTKIIGLNRSDMQSRFPDVSYRANKLIGNTD